VRYNKEKAAKEAAERAQYNEPILLAAIRSIAAGHNDPRTLAEETLLTLKPEKGTA
jgi:hypothetical protein